MLKTSNNPINLKTEGSYLAQKEELKNEIEENSSKGGKIGGKIVGVMPWWTNGLKNVRTYESPGDTWRRGMTKRKHLKMEK